MSNAKQATPHSALIAELMDSRVPKTEREHAAIREIETLRERLAQKGEPSAEPIQPNEVLFAVEIPEGYGDVHPELLGEDAFSGKGWVRWRVVPTDEPSAEPTRDDVIAFLLGEGPLDGVWFDEPHPTYKGRFWWRTYLRKATGPSAEPVDLQDIEQYRMQMAGICTAALGYWREGDSVHPDYDTPALREVAELYAKYATLAAQPKRTPLTDEEIIEHFKANVNINSLLSFADGVRYAERKHGIGKA